MAAGANGWHSPRSRCAELPISLTTARNGSDAHTAVVTRTGLVYSFGAGAKGRLGHGDDLVRSLSPHYPFPKSKIHVPSVSLLPPPPTPSFSCVSPPLCPLLPLTAHLRAKAAFFFPRVWLCFDAALRGHCVAVQSRWPQPRGQLQLRLDSSVVDILPFLLPCFCPKNHLVPKHIPRSTFAGTGVSPVPSFPFLYYDLY